MSSQKILLRRLKQFPTNQMTPNIETTNTFTIHVQYLKIFNAERCLSFRKREAESVEYLAASSKDFSRENGGGSGCRTIKVGDGAVLELGINGCGRAA